MLDVTSGHTIRSPPPPPRLHSLWPNRDKYLAVNSLCMFPVPSMSRAQKFAIKCLVIENRHGLVPLRHRLNHLHLQESCYAVRACSRSATQYIKMQNEFTASTTFLIVENNNNFSVISGAEVGCRQRKKQCVGLSHPYCWQMTAATTIIATTVAARR